MGYCECQNCGLLVNDVYNEPPRKIKHQSVFSMCDRVMMTIQNTGGVSIGCHLTGDVCSSRNCPIKDFINSELTKIDVCSQLLQNMSVRTDECKLLDTEDLIQRLDNFK